MGAASMIFDRMVRRFEDTVCVLALSVIVVLVLVQVFYRYVLSSGILWIDELVTNLMVLLVLVGAARATRLGVHTDLRMLLDNSPPRVRSVLKAAGVLVTLTFVLTLIYASANYAYDSRRLATTMIGIPLWLAYGAIPLGSLLILYEFTKLTVGAILAGRFSQSGPGA